MVSRQLPCPKCQHEHCWLNCEFCPCQAHIQPGIYPRESHETTALLVEVRITTTLR